jgi:hypothetical protein
VRVDIYLWNYVKKMQICLQEKVCSFSRMSNLDMLLSALRTIQPTSRDSERVFSVAGNLRQKEEVE